MQLRKMLVSAAVLAAAAFATQASAGIVYVGSWEVDQGPSWSNGPAVGQLAYTGQEAAALLFGGSPADYVISTIDSNPADVNDMAWYSILGYNPNGGSLLADDYSNKYEGQYYGPTLDYPRGDPNGPASAYIYDNAKGPGFTNYAFRVTGVPEPATWAMLLLGLAGLGAALRTARRRDGAAIAAA